MSDAKLTRGWTKCRALQTLPVSVLGGEETDDSVTGRHAEGSRTLDSTPRPVGTPPSIQCDSRPSDSIRMDTSETGESYLSRSSSASHMGLSKSV